LNHSTFNGQFPKFTFNFTPPLKLKTFYILLAISTIFSMNSYSYLQK